jgi:hypothetical protein
VSCHDMGKKPMGIWKCCLQKTIRHLDLP